LTVGLVDWSLDRNARCKQGVALTGGMGLDGRLYRVNGLYEMIRGAAANGINHFIVPAENMLHDHKDLLVEWRRKDKPSSPQGNHRVKGCGFVAEDVLVDRSSSSRLQVLAAETMEDPAQPLPHG
jgi:PDZ domain-containing secreted protein